MFCPLSYIVTYGMIVTDELVVSCSTSPVNDKSVWAADIAHPSHCDDDVIVEVMLKLLEAVVEAEAKWAYWRREASNNTRHSIVNDSDDFIVNTNHMK